MLGKLIKYEFKSQYTLYGGMYLFLLLMSIICTVTDKLSDKWDNTVFVMLFSLSAFAVVLGLIAVFAVTLVMSILRYRNNLLKDEGYLMHTLPVSPVSLHFTKMLAAFVWFTADFAVMMLMVAIISGDWKFSWVGDLADFFALAGLETTTSMVITGVLYIIISLISSLSMFYVSMNLGNLSYSSKGLMSFVAYLVLYMISQVVSTIAMVISGLFQARGNFGVFLTITEEDVPPVSFVTGTFVAAIILGIIFIVVYNAVSVYILNKKLNLE